MTDLIDRQAAINAIINLLSPGEIGSGDIITLTRLAEMWECTDELEKLPAIDAVEVVRCRDCEYFSEPRTFDGKCTLRGDYIFTNDFCSYAVERRTDEQSN